MVVVFLRSLRLVYLSLRFALLRKMPQFAIMLDISYQINHRFCNRLVFLNLSTLASDRIYITPFFYMLSTLRLLNVKPILHFAMRIRFELTAERSQKF